MLPCSVRRVAVTAPQAPLLSTLPLAAAASTRTYYRPLQRRRYSSSKPSRDNGSEDPPVRQAVQPAAEAKTAEAKAASGEKRKRKTKDVSDKLKYPSVPTTAHIPSDVLALSSFFSLHRPISVTRGLPRMVTEDVFASIFVAPSRAAKTAEVMSTLSRTVSGLEQQQQQQQQSTAGLSLKQLQQQEAQLRHQRALEADAQAKAMNEESKRAEARANDGSMESISVQVSNMVGQFLPYRPPPLPVAERGASQHAAKKASGADEHQQAMMMTAEEESNSAVAAEAEQDVQTRVYKAVFTIEETTDGNGEVKIVAHSPKMIEDPLHESSTPGSFEGSPAATMILSVERANSTSASATANEGEQPRPFLERMALRQLKFYEAQTRLQRFATLWYMISVKRQRKLKMKKKKYKKLTRRLRHERLKHGRT